MLGLLFAVAVTAGSPGAAAEYPHASFRSCELGQGSRSYWLFEPRQPSPARAPVVVFLHGWLAANPGLYGAWIEHLARRGNVVIFPRYYQDGMTNPADYVENARAAVKDALDVLRVAPDRVRPDLDRVAFLGHSAGGNLAAQLAADPGPNLPRPRSVLAFLPGEVRRVAEPVLSGIAPETLLLVAAADGDVVVGDLRARAIFAEASAVPTANKLFALFRTDRSGEESILADHFAPSAYLTPLDTGEGPLRAFQMARASVNRLDRQGFWRLADRVLSASFEGRTMDQAIAGASEDLGNHPDGRPVLPPVLAHDPALVPRVFPPNGARLLPLGLAGGD